MSSEIDEKFKEVKLLLEQLHPLWEKFSTADMVVRELEQIALTTAKCIHQYQSEVNEVRDAVVGIEMRVHRILDELEGKLPTYYGVTVESMRRGRLERVNLNPAIKQLTVMRTTKKEDVDV